jgi:hypothetical protein
MREKTFYVADEESLQKARGFLINRQWTSLTGTVGSTIGMFCGIVQSVDEDTTSSARRWRITMRE